MPVGFNEFGDDVKIDFNQSIHDYLGESGPTAIRLKGVRSAGNIPSDNLSSRLSTPSGQAFANRYDFGASLTAAVQAAKDAMSTKSDGLYMRPHSRRPMAPAANTTKPSTAEKLPAAPGPAETDKAVPAAGETPTAAGTTASPSVSISSSSYEELVNKYCFVRT